MPLLQYNFETIGRSVIDRDLASIERRLVEHNARISRLLGRVAPGTRAGAPVANDTDRQLRAVERTAKQGAAAQVREERRAAQAKVREQLAASRAIGKEQRVQLKESQRQHDYWHRARLGSERQRASEEKREHASRLRMIAAERRASDRFTRGTFSSAMSSVGGAVRSVGSTGVMMAGLGGAGLAATAISQASQLDDMSRRISILGRGKGQAGLDPASLSKRFTQVGIARGVNPEEIARGVETFTSLTGNLKGAMQDIDMFATVAQGAGAKTEELAGIGAMLEDIMNIKSPREKREAFAMLVQQGKLGSFELRAMAQDLPQVAGSAARAGVTGISGLRQLGGLMQVGMSEIRSAPETSTAVQTMFRQLQAKSADIQSGKAFSGRKVQVFEGGDPTKPMRNFVDVLAESLVASRGNIVELQEVFDVRGIRAVSPLITAFRDASAQVRKNGGDQKAQNAAGRAAMEARLEEFNIVGDFNEIERDAADAMKGFSVQMSRLTTMLKDAVASELFPQLVALGPELVKLVPVVREITKAGIGLANFFMENPVAGIGSVLAIAVTKEIVAAKIGAAILKAVLGGGGAAAGVGGALGKAGTAVGGAVPAGPGVGGKLVGATAGLFAGFAIGEVLHNEVVAPSMDRAFRRGSKITDTASSAQAMAAHGVGSPEERAAVAAKLRQDIAEMQDPKAREHRLRETLKVGLRPGASEEQTQAALSAKRQLDDEFTTGFFGTIASTLGLADSPQEQMARRLADAQKQLAALEASGPGQTPGPSDAVNAELDADLFNESVRRLGTAADKLAAAQPLNRGPSPTPTVD